MYVTKTSSAVLERRALTATRYEALKQLRWNHPEEFAVLRELAPTTPSGWSRANTALSKFYPKEYAKLLASVRG